jgi:glycosyltransferase involved in cell wall biosynthesis
MKDEIELTVIMPAYNEEAVIKKSVSATLDALKKFKESWELIAVNDGSSDSTKEILEKLKTENKNLRLISYEQNKGRGYALRQGIDASKGKYVITIESDQSWGTDIIFELHRNLKENFLDAVIASPYMKGGKMLNVPFKRVLPSRLGNIILSLAFSGRFSTISGMTRGYRGEAIRNLHLRENGKEIHLEILSKATAENLLIDEIPATVKWSDERKNQTRGRSSLFKTLKLSATHLLFGFNQAPLLLFGPPAAICLSSGFIIGLWLAYKYFILGMVIGGQTILILSSVFLIIMGMQFFIICFLAYQTKNTQTRLHQMQNSFYRLMKKLSDPDEID